MPTPPPRTPQNIWHTTAGGLGGSRPAAARRVAVALPFPRIDSVPYIFNAAATGGRGGAGEREGVEWTPHFASTCQDGRGGGVGMTVLYRAAMGEDGQAGASWQQK